MRPAGALDPAGCGVRGLRLPVAAAVREGVARRSGGSMTKRIGHFVGGVLILAGVAVWFVAGVVVR